MWFANDFCGEEVTVPFRARFKCGCLAQRVNEKSGNPFKMSGLFWKAEKRALRLTAKWSESAFQENWSQ
jgi:hypothetical protein